VLKHFFAFSNKEKTSMPHSIRRVSHLALIFFLTLSLCGSVFAAEHEKNEKKEIGRAHV